MEIKRKNKYIKWNPSDLITKELYPYEFQMDNDGLVLLFRNNKLDKLVAKIEFGGTSFYSMSNYDLRTLPRDEIVKQLGKDFLFGKNPYVQVLNSSLIEWLNIESDGYIEAVKDTDLFESHLKHYILFNPGDGMYEIITPFAPTVSLL